MIRKCVPIPQKIYKITKKRVKSPQEVEQYFLGFMAFIDSTEQQQIPRPVDNNKSCIIPARKDILLSRIRLWLIIVIISFIKQEIIRKEKTLLYIRYIKESSCNSTNY
jgi:hypothetical protein